MISVILHVLLVIAIIIAVLFVLSWIIYFTNGDMKLSASMSKLMEKHYDKMKRDKRL